MKLGCTGLTGSSVLLCNLDGIYVSQLRTVPVEVQNFGERARACMKCIKLKFIKLTKANPSICIIQFVYLIRGETKSIYSKNVWVLSQVQLDWTF